jgi:hypothetical protein
MGLGHRVEALPSGAHEGAHRRLAIGKHDALIRRSLGRDKRLQRKDEASKLRLVGRVPCVNPSQSWVRRAATELAEAYGAVSRAIRDRDKGFEFWDRLLRRFR